MKIFKISLTVVLLSIIFISCSKENGSNFPIKQTSNADTTPAVLLGIWKGTYVTTSRTAPVFLSFEIKPTGKLILLNEARVQVGTGNWQFSNAEFKAVYKVNATQVSYSLTGELISTPPHLNGQCKFGDNYADNGFWDLDKDN